MQTENVQVNSKRWLSLEDLLNEKWKDIEGYEKIYQISNYGRVKSFHNLLKNKSNKRKIKILKCSKQIVSNKTREYSRYKITLKYLDKRKDYRIHRLVAQAFIPNPENKPQVNHIDGNALNNCVDNLEWCTAQENIIHSFTKIRKKYRKYDENKILDMAQKGIEPKIIRTTNNISTTVYYRILKEHKVKLKGVGFWKNKYNIDLKQLKEDFKNGYSNKTLAVKYKTNNNLIAKYRQKYKKGMI